MGRLTGKIAIVTGAARGSGEVIARLMVAEGAKVVLGDIRDKLGEAVAKDLGEAAIFCHMDVTQEEDWQRVIEHSTAFGQLNVLVNNAAVLHIAPITQTSVEDYMRVVRVNELGTFLGVREVIEPMKAAGGGSIINISSIDGWHAAPGTSAYSASKFAVRGITKVAALELGRDGIRVNAINPAAVNLEMIEPFLSKQMLDNHDDNMALGAPIGRRGTSEDVAWAVVFLASDESGFFNGADLPLDGGMTAGMLVPGAIPGSR